MIENKNIVMKNKKSGAHTLSSCGWIGLRTHTH
jgi:hypothetical protein